MHSKEMRPTYEGASDARRRCPSPHVVLRSALHDDCSPYVGAQSTSNHLGRDQPGLWLVIGAGATRDLSPDMLRHGHVITDYRATRVPTLRLHEAMIKKADAAPASMVAESDVLIVGKNVWHTVDKHSGDLPSYQTARLRESEPMDATDRERPGFVDAHTYRAMPVADIGVEDSWSLEELRARHPRHEIDSPMSAEPYACTKRFVLVNSCRQRPILPARRDRQADAPIDPIPTPQFTMLSPVHKPAQPGDGKVMPKLVPGGCATSSYGPVRIYEHGRVGSTRWESVKDPLTKSSHAVSESRASASPAKCFGPAVPFAAPISGYNTVGGACKIARLAQRLDFERSMGHASFAAYPYPVHSSYAHKQILQAECTILLPSWPILAGRLSGISGYIRIRGPGYFPCFFNVLRSTVSDALLIEIDRCPWCRDPGAGLLQPRSSCICNKMAHVERFGALRWRAQNAAYITVPNLRGGIADYCFEPEPVPMAEKMRCMFRKTFEKLVWEPYAAGYMEVGPSWLGWMEAFANTTTIDDLTCHMDAGDPTKVTYIPKNWGPDAYILFDLHYRGIFHPMVARFKTTLTTWTIAYIPEINSYALAHKYHDDPVRAAILGAWTRWLLAQRGKSIRAIWQILLTRPSAAALSGLIPYLAGYGRITKAANAIPSLAALARHALLWEYDLNIDTTEGETLPCEAMDCNLW